MRGEDVLLNRLTQQILGSPPHARGRLVGVDDHELRGRITPACAGKTRSPGPRRRLGRDHPRMRGEDSLTTGPPPPFNGSPPHARGRLDEVAGGLLDRRITPACAGKTHPQAHRLSKSPDHPRMRGEDLMAYVREIEEAGSPPHARGRQSMHRRLKRRRRITPACAGKTAFLQPHRTLPGDHPRMRGEDFARSTIASSRSGSPPHARGRLTIDRRRSPDSGITPACAGKTTTRRFLCSTKPDHPRMRGEDVVMTWTMRRGTGSPPHARGRRRPSRRPNGPRRITPACAGKTGEPDEDPSEPQDHPRMRGEDRRDAGQSEMVAGSPPHARGRRIDLAAPMGTPGITPACAGKTILHGPKGPSPRDHPRMRGEDDSAGSSGRILVGSPPHARGRHL